MAEGNEIVVEGTMEGGTDLSEAVDDIASSALPADVEVDAPGEGTDGETPGKGNAAAAPGASTPGAVGDGQAAPPPGDLTPPGANEAPDSLSGEIKQMWATLPPQVQAEFQKRENDFRNFYEQSKPSMEIASGYAKMLEPYLGVMKQYGVNPVQHTEDLLKYHAILMFGSPQQKAEILSGLATDAGINLQALARGAIQSLPQNQIERQMAEMRAHLNGVAGRFTQQDMAQMEQQIAQMGDDAEAYPHFWDLAPAMIQELKANPRLPIDQAYRMALAANQTLFNSVMESRAQKKAAADAQAAREKAEKARKARGIQLGSSSPVRPASQGQARGMQDIGAAVDDAFSEMRSR